MAVALATRLPMIVNLVTCFSIFVVGHLTPVLVQANAGVGSGFTDDDYAAVGATIVPEAAEIWREAEMIMKVKEPVAPEWPLMRHGQVIFTYFHFAASEELTRAVMDSGSVAVAYETVALPSGELPLLTPMSEVAGRMAVQEGAKYLDDSSARGRRSLRADPFDFLERPPVY